MLAPTAKIPDGADGHTECCSSGRPGCSGPSNGFPDNGLPVDGVPGSSDAKSVQQQCDNRPSPTARSCSAESLLEEHYDRVYRYAYRLTGNATVAEDVAQEVFVRAIKGMHQLREANAALGWLLVITRREFARWCRKAAAQPRASGEDPAEEQGSGSLNGTNVPSQQNQLEQQDWVQRSLMELPADYRLVVTMFYFDQLTYAEIAAELEIPMGTVMSRLSRAKKQLKDALIAFSEPCKRGSC